MIRKLVSAMMLALTMTFVVPAHADDPVAIGIANRALTIANGTASAVAGSAAAAASAATNAATSATNAAGSATNAASSATAAASSAAIAQAGAASFVPAKNKFNAVGTKLANAQIRDDNGQIQTNAAFTGSVYTDYQPISPSTAYASNNGANVKLSWYDVNKTWISNVNISSAASVTSPSNAAFVRFGVDNSINAATLQIEPGTVATAYEAYHVVLSSAALPTIGTSNLASGAVTIPNTAFFTPGKNKFDASQPYTATAQLNGSGQISVNAAFAGVVYNTYFPALANTSYIANAASNVTIAWYNSAFAYISAGSSNSGLPIISPAGAAYYRIGLPNSLDRSNFQFEIGSVVTYFEPYAAVIGNGPTAAQINAALRWAANDLSLPRKEYLLKGVENNLYHRTLQRRWSSDLFSTRMTGTVGGATILSRDRYSRLTPTATGSATLTATLYDGELDPVVIKSTLAIVTDPATPTNATNVMMIGDSFLDIGVIMKTVVQTIPNVTLVGTRKVTNIQGTTWSGQDLRFEGRSGATLAYLFTAIKSPSSGVGASGFSPFIQPTSTYNFIGNTNSWKTAAAQTPGASFVASLFSAAQTFRGGFSSSTGYPATPQTNDLLWDDSQNGFYYWNGSAWTAVTLDTTTWTFNFAKYLSVWGVTAPNIVYVAMGVNDFQSAAPRDVAGNTGPVVQSRNLFAGWHTSGGTGYMDQLIASVQAYNANIKIGILVPSVLSADMSNVVGRFTRSMNAAMWEARKQVISTWDSASWEAQNVYVVDCGRAIDPTFGYTTSTVANDNLPFAQYADSPALNDNKILDSIHPSAGGFTQYGVALAAFLQAVR